MCACVKWPGDYWAPTKRFVFANLKLIREQTHLQFSNMPPLSLSLAHSQTLIMCIISDPLLLFPLLLHLCVGLHCWTHCWPGWCGNDVIYEQSLLNKLQGQCSITSHSLLMKSAVLTSSYLFLFLLLLTTDDQGCDKGGFLDPSSHIHTLIHTQHTPIGTTVIRKLGQSVI